MRGCLVALLGLSALVLGGCAVRHKPATNWRLRTFEDGGLLLVPPLPPKGQSVMLARARSVKKAGPGCGVATPEIRLTWRGRTARVDVKPEAIGPLGPMALTGGPVRLTGEPLRDLAWWVRFGKELEQREREGCLATGEGDRLSKRIIENLALAPGLAFQLRYGNYVVTGYFDLEPQFALKSVAPLLKPGIRQYQTLSDVLGYETTYYDLKPRSGGGVKIAVRAVEHNVGGKITKKRRPVIEPITLPDSARHVRYFFRVWQVKGERRIALLGASRPELLDGLTKRFEADPEGFCSSVRAAEASCMAVPKEMVVAPEVEVRANGQPAYALIGGTVGETLRFAGVRQQKEVLPGIEVLRPWNGLLLPVEFDRSRADILRLVLIGGEDIRW